MRISGVNQLGYLLLLRFLSYWFNRAYYATRTILPVFPGNNIAWNSDETAAAHTAAGIVHNTYTCEIQNFSFFEGEQAFLRV